MSPSDNWPGVEEPHRHLLVGDHGLGGSKRSHPGERWVTLPRRGPRPAADPADDRLTVGEAAGHLGALPHLGVFIGTRPDEVPWPASWGTPKSGHPDPASAVGIDVGVRWLATVATAKGVIERVPSPAPLARNLTALQRRSRSISRSQRGSARCWRKERRRARLHAHLAAIRRHAIHRLTTRLAPTHGRIVVEGLDAAGMLRQRGLPGVRARRRGLADAALAAAPLPGRL